MRVVGWLNKLRTLPKFRLTGHTHHTFPRCRLVILSALESSFIRSFIPPVNVISCNRWMAAPAIKPSRMPGLLFCQILALDSPITQHYFQPRLPALALLTVALPLARPTPRPLVPRLLNIGAFLSMSGTMMKRTWLPRI